MTRFKVLESSILSPRLRFNNQLARLQRRRRRRQGMQKIYSSRWLKSMVMIHHHRHQRSGSQRIIDLDPSQLSVLLFEPTLPFWNLNDSRNHYTCTAASVTLHWWDLLMLLNKSEANAGVVSNPSTLKINIFLILIV